MNWNAITTTLCALSLGATAYLVASMPREGGDRVAQLETKLAAAEKRADAVESLRAEVRELKERLDRRMADVSQRVAQVSEIASPRVPDGMRAAGAARGDDQASRAVDAAGEPLED